MWKDFSGELFAYRNNYHPDKYGEDMVSTQFTSIFRLYDGQPQNRYLTKNIAESEESWLGLGFSKPNQKEWFSLETKLNTIAYNYLFGKTGFTISLDTDVQVYKR